jgi:hypothetical protein
LGSENRYLTPTYQSLLILGMDTVAKRLCNGEIFGSWEALKTLYAELPPDCQKECCDDFNSVKAKLVDIVVKIQGIDLYRTKARRALALRRYLAVANLELFNVFKDSLFAKGYLENAPTKPRNPQPETLGE